MRGVKGGTCVRLSPAAERIAEYYEVDFSGDELILTCRACGARLPFSQAYHVAWVTVFAAAHKDVCEGPHAARPL